jgi:hypothetical protein
MKKVITFFGAILFASTILTSCGGSGKEAGAGTGEEKKKVTEVTIKPKSNTIKGDLGEYFEVIDKDYLIKAENEYGGAIISVEVKRTDKDFDFPTENINPFGTNGGEDYHVGFGIELLGESGPISIKQATSGGMGGPYSSDDVTSLMKLNKGETAYIRWSVNELDGLKSFQLSSALQKEEHNSSSSSDESLSDDASSESSSSSSSMDCDKFCSDYEAFANSYVAFMKKYKSNPSDPSILAEYADIMSKSNEMSESSANCAADPAVAARISKALSKIAKAAM